MDADALPHRFEADIAFAQGRLAFREGRAKSSNPYGHSQPRGGAWDAGFDLEASAAAIAGDETKSFARFEPIAVSGAQRERVA